MRFYRRLPGCPMNKLFAYAAFGWLAFSGVMHFFVDVVSQHLRGLRMPGVETTLYYGLHTAYATGQALFGILGLLVIRHAFSVFEQGPAKALCVAAFCAWTAICLAFVEYWEPLLNLGVFGVFLSLALTMSRRPASES